MKARHRHGLARGFTLIELLIALALMSLVTLLLFSGLKLGSRAWNGVDQAAERIGALRVSRGFLARALSQVRAASVVFEAVERPVFGGDGARLEFAAPLAEQVGVPGLYILRLTIEPVDGRDALILTRWLIHPEILAGNGEAPAWEPLTADGGDAPAGGAPDGDAAAGAFGRTLLLEDVAAFEIAYFGVAAGDSAADWHPDWFDQPEPPAALRIRLTTVSQGWPDLIVALPGADTTTGTGGNG